MVSAILLAAGSSTRMGDQDKLFLKYKGQWLVNHVMQQLWASNIDELIIVRKDNTENLLNGQSSDRIKIALNPLAEKGMTTSIQVGVRASDPNTNGYMICQADMPLIQAAEYNRIIDVFEKGILKNDKCIAVPFYQGKKGNPIIFSARYRDLILGHEKMEGCRKIVKEHFEFVERVEMVEDHVLVDVDTVVDWAALRER